AGGRGGPESQRPDYPMPSAFRGAAPQGTTDVVSLGELSWLQIFQDNQLQELIRTALTENYDLRIAVTRILDAQAQLTITRSAQFPSLDANVSVPYSRTEGARSQGAPSETLAPVGGVHPVLEDRSVGPPPPGTRAAPARPVASSGAPMHFGTHP